MKKFCKIVTVALVFCVGLASFAACNANQFTESNMDIPKQDSEQTIATPKPDAPDDTKDTNDADDTKDNKACGDDCNCQSPVICDHEICEHEWEDWLEITKDGKLIKIVRCTKNQEHIDYVITDVVTQPEPTEPTDPEPTEPDEPDEPSFTLDADYLVNNTWQGDYCGVELVFHTDGTKTKYVFGKNYGTWEIIDNTTIKLTHANGAAVAVSEFFLHFDSATKTLVSDATFYALGKVTFTLVE